MKEKELWTMKYAPQKENEIVGNPKAVKVIKEFLLNWSPKNQIKALLLLGPPGCGKTSSTHLLAKLNNFDVIEINASDVRNKKILEEELIPTLSTNLIFKGKKKLYLIDEVDGLSGSQDRGGLSAMLRAVELSKFPIIFTANDISHQKFSSFRRKKGIIKTVKFQKIKDLTIVKVLQKICKAENIKADTGVLQEIAINVNNDLRSAINDLQSIAEGKSEITLLDVRGLKQMRDVVKNIYEVLTIIFTNKNIQDCNKAVSMLDIDWGMLLQWVNESLPYHNSSPEILYKAYKALSKADLIYNYIASNPEKISWSLLPYFIDLISSGVTLPIKNQNIKQKVLYFRNYPIFFYNSFRMYNSKDMINVINKIKSKLKANSVEIVTKHIPYIALILKNRSPKSQELAEFYQLERREVNFLKKFA